MIAASPPNEEAALAGGSLNSHDNETITPLDPVLQDAIDLLFRPTPPSIVPNVKEVATLIRRYRLLHAVQRPFEYWFWLLEQKKGKLADRLANLGVSV